MRGRRSRACPAVEGVNAVAVADVLADEVLVFSRAWREMFSRLRQTNDAVPCHTVSSADCGRRVWPVGGGVNLRFLRLVSPLSIQWWRRVAMSVAFLQLVVRASASAPCHQQFIRVLSVSLFVWLSHQTATGQRDRQPEWIPLLGKIRDRRDVNILLVRVPRKE